MLLQINAEQNQNGELKRDQQLPQTLYPQNVWYSTPGIAAFLGVYTNPLSLDTYPWVCIRICSAVVGVPHHIRSHACVQPHPTRWTTTLSSKVNLPHAINFRAVCGANLGTIPTDFGGNETRAAYCVGPRGFTKPLQTLPGTRLHLLS